ncbi:olfactory receptor 734-like [Gopherus flavomarginatus]|uniref:olfactory receptor 734-like n=1 Tax=Gopherus flavomarginatus TaxID=286002 RepID=UPI0021CBC648|nr:olfactory receptor 734-like [Gopherus flavomarginatus]
MEHENGTGVTEFVLLGLSQTREIQLFLFILFLVFYSIILPANILIILTIQSDPHLGFPMYFFLANLAFLDICYCSVTPPKMLADFFSHHKTISYGGCMAQLFFIHFLGGAEIFLLMGMAFDRYVAICHPLRYASIMSREICCALVGAAWAGGFTHSILQVVLIIRLPFCGPNELDNFFCDITQVIKLACTDIYVLEFFMFFNSGLVTLMCFLLLLISYGALLVRLQMGNPSKGMSKAASTCVTHIIIVFIMFGPAIYIYCRPFQSFPPDKVVAVFHTVVFPLMNPMIYTLRNKEIISAMKRLLSRWALERAIEGS